MNPEHRRRLEALPKRWCTPELIRDILGLDLAGDRRLRETATRWCSAQRDAQLTRSTSSGGLEVQRYELETFLAERGLVSWKLAAVHLGMSEQNLRDVYDALQERGLEPELSSSVAPDQLVRKRAAELLYRSFPSLRFSTFSDHSSMCRRLHDAIQRDLIITIDPVVCITSAHLHEDPTDFASGLDSVTGEPVGVRYRVWLDTKKPIYLAPDVCSTWFYAKHLRELAGHVYPGTEPSTDLLERLRDAA